MAKRGLGHTVLFKINLRENIMSAKFVKGRTRFIQYPKKASTAFVKNSFIAFDGSGAVKPATATDAAVTFAGICVADVASSAGNAPIYIEIPKEKECLVEADGATLSAGLVGTTVDLTDAVTVNGGASAVDVVRLVKYISATKGLFTIVGLE